MMNANAVTHGIQHIPKVKNSQMQIYSHQSSGVPQITQHSNSHTTKSTNANKFEPDEEETFEQRLERIKRNKLGLRPPSGDLKLRKQNNS